MTHSLVICLLLAVIAGICAAVSAAMAGWGWLAVLATYSATGSTTLLIAAVAASKAITAPARVVPARPVLDWSARPAAGSPYRRSCS